MAVTAESGSPLQILLRNHIFPLAERWYYDQHEETIETPSVQAVRALVVVFSLTL